MPDIVFELIKISTAVVCGALMGFERQRHEKAAGLRTHILICLGSCLVTMSGLKIIDSASGGDLLRIIQAVMIGIGFLGAGAIIYEKGTLIGLTSAAAIWVLAAIGITIGIGSFSLAAIATGISVVTLRLR